MRVNIFSFLHLRLKFVIILKRPKLIIAQMFIAMNLRIQSIRTAARKNPVLTLNMIITVTVVILAAIMAPIIL